MENVQVMSNDTDYYVALTGSKNNAGDFLIKYRAKKLFKEYRSDRDFVDLNAWVPFDINRLDLINNAKALILLGGPSLQYNMYPGIYKLTENLNEIKTPIVMMGVGWKSIKGNWEDTYEYPLNRTTLNLLDRIHDDGLTSSVRDFHTLNTLQHKGYENVLMTGCPAYYDLEYKEANFEIPKSINKVAFSLGVSFLSSSSMERQMKNQILSLKEQYAGKKFEVVFHHSLDPEVFLQAHGATVAHNKRHRDFADWLIKQGIEYVDISGSAEHLIHYYSSVDLHVGYRVHAHIFMNSIKKLSLLISEDGRAKGSKSVIGGMVVDGYLSYRDDLFTKILGKAWPNLDRYIANKFCSSEIRSLLNYEMNVSAGQYSLLADNALKNNHKIMQNFLESLP